MPATLLEPPREATTAELIEQLYRVPENEKAEIVEGEVRYFSPTGAMPRRASSRIFVSLLRHEDEEGDGQAFPDNVGFLVNLPNRGSFSPDAARYDRPASENTMKFASGAPVFAAEVRSEGDYGPKAEREIAQKIADYLAAGKKVVWDVDLLNPDTIRVYRVGVECVAATFRRWGCGGRGTGSGWVAIRGRYAVSLTAYGGSGGFAAV